MNKPEKVALVLIPTALLALLAISLTRSDTTQSVYARTTYYFLMATVMCWAGAHLHATPDGRRAAAVAWAKENWPGIVLALAVTVVAWLAVSPALRMLSDEANLVGTSKNFFNSHAATFTVSGKNYYDSFWDVDVAIDQRPPLFPFLVSLVHAVCGYSYRNVFLFNLLLLPVFVLTAYRLAKKLAGETFAIVASLLVLAHPITLIAVRSGGFDFLALFFALLVIKSLLDHIRAPSAPGLAILWMNLCMFAEIRYESALFIPPMVVLLLLLKLVTRDLLRPYAFIYALTPAFLIPRIEQAVWLGSVPRQDPGTITFSLGNFLHNLHEYFKPVLAPSHSFPAHSALVIALGLVGCLLWSRSCLRLWRAQEKTPPLKFAGLVAAWMLVQAILLFTYWWGRAQQPASARLMLPIDTFFSFAAAWTVTWALRRWRPFVAIVLAAAVLAINVPAAAQNRMLNRLTQTRECATTWRFFESLHEKRILIVTDRPNLYTIMDYGAMSFEAAKNDPYLLEALARRLFYDIYVVQQIKLKTKQPLPGYEIWPDRKLDTMLEFQNDADVLIRISRLAH
jgi:hypothetical protein